MTTQLSSEKVNIWPKHTQQRPSGAAGYGVLCGSVSLMVSDRLNQMTIGRVLVLSAIKQ
mgnify:CR=1 FL=1